MHFVQAKKFDRVSAAMREFGLSRILLHGISESHAPGKIERMIRAFNADPWFRDKYALAMEAGQKMVYATPDSVKIYPVWHLATDSALDLKAMAETNGMVFIKNEVRNFMLASKKTDNIAQRRTREMWEVVNALGDAGTKQCKFIIYGFYQLQPHYTMGMSGGAFNPDTSANWSKVYMLGGRSEVFSEDQIPRYMEEFGITREIASDFVSVNVRSFQMQPEYLKEFYRTIDRVHLLDAKFSVALDVADKAYADDFWVSTFREDYVRLRPHAQIWSTIGDKNLCNNCSVAFSCRYYEKEAVCSLPGTEGRKLASLLGSRDAAKVIEGVGKLLEYQAARFEEAAEAEFNAREEAKVAGDPMPPLDPMLNTMANDLQKNAKQYALLLNPNLLKPQVKVEILAGQVGVNTVEATPQLMAQAARELEAAGTSRDNITPSMLYDHIANKTGGKVIEGEVIDGIKRDF